ncbi:hypothetical protein SAMN06265379_10513 [Saccharicrinis carchari]|uniref:Uncharacterized protein n=1 Tax=Saccharicrinis carchari TaxID=1168039 RepID=A0A521DB96_SACCC|nr:hypothetical protein [Saccharicrinis carchari]SMO68905.1 hypothetical protein SAMN06265379_10513 [Saccharicrinis carchari]
MDKEALLNIILSDLGEIETMVKSFRGQGKIPVAFIELTEKKMAHLMEEFSMLKNINSERPMEPEVQHPVNKQDDKEEAKPIVSSLIEKEAGAPATDSVLSMSEAQQENEPEDDTGKNKVEETNTIDESPLATVDDNPTENVVSGKKSSYIEDPKTEESIKTIGETFGGEKKSVNDFMAKVQQPGLKNNIKGKPVNDLTKGLGINDRFMFQRELFEGKPELMSHALQQINQMPDLASALSFIQTNFDWDREQEATQAFISYVERKF